MKRKAAAIVDDTRSSPLSLPPTLVNAVVSQSHPATIGDTQSSSFPLPPGYRIDLIQNSFSGSLHSLHSISYPPIPDDDHLARPTKVSKRAEPIVLQKGASAAEVYLNSTYHCPKHMVDGNSFATIERLHRQEVISTALALFFQYPSLAVAV
jgi:hypothetical protein